MNYIELMHQVWALREQGMITAHEQDLYMYLVHKCCLFGWKNPFAQTTNLICAELGIERHAVIVRRNKLKQLGLIDFEEGKTRGKPAQYRLCVNKTTHTYTHTYTQYDTHSDTHTATQPVTHSDTHCEHDATKSRACTCARAEEESLNNNNKTLGDRSPLHQRSSGSVEFCTTDLLPHCNSENFAADSSENPVQRYEDRWRNSPHKAGAVRSVRDLQQELQSSMWLEQVAMTYLLKTLQAAQQWLERFTSEMELCGEPQKTYKDYQAHFVRWLKIELSKQQKHGFNQVKGENETEIYKIPRG